jgi:hypothetical protein
MTKMTRPAILKSDRAQIELFNELSTYLTEISWMGYDASEIYNAIDEFENKSFLKATRP